MYKNNKKMLKLEIDFKLDIDDQEIVDKMKRVLMKSMFKMEELVIKNAPFDRGFLRQNITLFPEILSDKYVLTSKAPYSAAMEYGTRPFYAPIEPLKGWAHRKLGDESLGWAIRGKIAAVGITAQPYMRPSLIEVESFWVGKFFLEEFKVI